MATLESGESNILEAEAINWRLFIYPVAGVLAVLILGVVYYYYSLNQRIEREAAAHDALTAAKTPEQYIKVADQFPDTNHATMALLDAGEASFEKKDFDGATKAYQRILANSDTDSDLRDSAQLGLAATLEATNKGDDAISAYMVVAHRGNGSGFAPFAYNAVARIYEQRHDKDNERRVLTEAAGLGEPDSPFVKEATERLKTLQSATDAASAAAMISPPTLPAAPAAPGTAAH